MAGTFQIESADGRFQLTAGLMPQEPDSSDEDRRAACDLSVELRDWETGAVLKSTTAYEYQGEDYGAQLRRAFDEGDLLATLYEKNQSEMSSRSDAPSM